MFLLPIYSRSILIEPAQVEYVVEAIDDDKDPQSWTVKGDSIRRDKTVFSKDRTKLFLKQHISLRILLSLSSSY